jgi:hypothetical protein
LFRIVCGDGLTEPVELWEEELWERHEQAEMPGGKVEEPFPEPCELLLIQTCERHAAERASAARNALVSSASDGPLPDADRILICRYAP